MLFYVCEASSFAVRQEKFDHYSLLSVEKAFALMELWACGCRDIYDVQWRLRVFGVC